MLPLEELSNGVNVQDPQDDNDRELRYIRYSEAAT